MLSPVQAIDRIRKAFGPPPGYRSLHAKGRFYTGTFTATPRQWDGKDPATLVSLLREGVNELAEAIAQGVEKK